MKMFRFLVCFALCALAMTATCYMPQRHSMTFYFGTLAPAATPGPSTSVRCADLIAQVGTILTWAGSAQTCNNNNAIVTRATFVSWIKNNGSCASGANATYYVMKWSDMTACAVTTSVHTNLLANYNFSSTSASWSGPTYTTLGGVSTYCNSTYYGDAFASSGGPNSGDGTYEVTSTANANTETNECSPALTQAFTTSGTPTSQTVTVYYKIVASGGTGDTVNCNPYASSGGVTIKLNSSAQNVAVTSDSAWHQATLTTTAMVNGSNTIYVEPYAVSGTNQTYNVSKGTCNVAVPVAGAVYVSEINVTATW